MGDTARITRLDSTSTARVLEFVNEANHGPLKGGIAGELELNSVKIDAVASRDWGVQFTRTLPGGVVDSVRLAGPEVTADDANDALARLLQAA